MTAEGAPRVERDGDVVTLTMCRPAKRNALSRDHLTQLLAAVGEVGESDAAGLVIAAEGPVFSAGHDFADVAGRPVPEVRSLLWLCTELMQTLHDVPQVVLARVLALAGDVIDAATALDWGLVNRVVPDAELDAAVADLMARATRGSRASKAWGKQTMHAQLGRPERDAYTTAVEVMAAASQLPGAVEGMSAFLEKRRQVWPD